MAPPKRDQQMLVFSLIVSFSLVFIGILVILFFVQMPTPSAELVSAADQQEDTTSTSIQADPAPAQPAPAEAPAGSSIATVAFGQGAADDFETNDWDGGSGQWAQGRWEVDDGGGSKMPDLRLQDDKEILPFEGEYMGRIRDKGMISRQVSLKDAESPVLTFQWAFSGLHNTDRLKLQINGETHATMSDDAGEYTWQEEAVDLSAFTGQQIEIRFKISGSDSDDIGYIDDVRVYEAASP